MFCLCITLSHRKLLNYGFEAQHHETGYFKFLFRLHPGLRINSSQLLLTKTFILMSVVYSKLKFTISQDISNVLILGSWLLHIEDRNGVHCLLSIRIEAVNPYGGETLSRDYTLLQQRICYIIMLLKSYWNFQQGVIIRLSRSNQWCEEYKCTALSSGFSPK